MCLSIVGQIAFGALMVLCLALTLGSMFSPGWYDNGSGKRHGIINCGSEDNTQQQNEDSCRDWWNVSCFCIHKIFSKNLKIKGYFRVSLNRLKL